MDDEILGHLRMALAACKLELVKSRELSLVTTKIEEAILWRQLDLQQKSSVDVYSIIQNLTDS